MRACVTELVAAPTGTLRRRDIIAWLGGAALAPMAWPLGARAQSGNKQPIIGFLGATTPSVWSPFVDSFVRRLRELGWIDGGNIMIDYRWAEGKEERYAEYAAEFVRDKVDIIVTAGTPAVMAVKRATSVIPIVFASAGDPVGMGLVASLARPGGNVTGLSSEQTDLVGYRLELLREVVPGLSRVAIMGNVGTAIIVSEMDAVAAAAPKLGLATVRLEIRKMEDIEPGILSLKGRADALYVCTDPLMSTHRVRINTLAIGEKLPTMNSFREYVVAGGLLSYGPNFPDLFRRAAEFVDKILRGTKPADIPVEQPVKFDLIVNAITAKALSLTIPEPVLIRANEVIE